MSIITRLVLLLLYVMVLTPLAFMARLVGFDRLGVTNKNAADSYWKERKHRVAFEKQ